jgi:hypothetical protein
MTQRFPSVVRPLIAASLVAAFLVVPEVASPAEACASRHLTALLAGFAGGNAAPHFYMTAENDTPAPFRIEAEIDGCRGDDPASVSWQTESLTATAGIDYQQANGTTDDLNDPVCDSSEHCQRARTVNVTIFNDTESEAVSETLRVSISTTSGNIVPPDSVPMYIVDDEGATPRVALAQPLSTQPYQQMEHFTTARIPVLRAGPVTSQTTVGYTLSGGPGVPAEANDYGPASGTVTFDAGDRLEFITFAISNDTFPEGDETITATLTGTGVETPSSMTFTILDNDNDSQAPVTRFHHPRNGLKYEYNDYRIREMHTYFSDPGGSGVVKAWIALRLQRLSGQCAWYNGSRFTNRPCGSRRWLPMRYSQTGDLYFFRIGALRSSIGTEIKNYRAWTRAEDGAGNLEKTFQAGRNLSTFEVKRR